MTNAFNRYGRPEGSDCLPFWRAFLKKDTPRYDEWEDAKQQDFNWCGCAIGALFDVRGDASVSEVEVPDPALSLGHQFSTAIREHDMIDARRIFAEIESISKI